jgi:hypothetical protein
MDGATISILPGLRLVAGRLAAYPRGRRAMAWTAVLCLSLGAAGCVQSLPIAELPSLARDPQKLLTKDEQQRAINELSSKKDAQQTEAARETQKPR